MEWLSNSFGRMGIMRIPGDGNCLFAAILDQVKSLGIPRYQNLNISRLRNKVASYIATNPNRFMQQILDSINELAPRYDKIAPNLRFKEFIEDLRKEGFWGGAESLKATCNLLKVAISIFQVGPVSSNYQFTPDQGIARYTIKLLFCGQEGLPANHYDSIRLFLPNAPGQGVPTLAAMGGEVMHRLPISYDTLTPVSYQKVDLFPKFNLSPINSYEVEIRDQQRNLFDSQPGKDRVNVATWNVRGGWDKGKRDKISGLLKDENITIACLQETHLTEGQYINEDFTWYTSGGSLNKSFRGVAILTRTNAAVMEKFLPINENLAVGWVNTVGKKFAIISCHIPNKAEEARKDFEMLSSLIYKLSNGGIEVIVAGDFNAHLGYQDIDVKDKRLIGMMLKHEHSNENGLQFKNLIILHDLILLTSWSNCKSVLTTWRSNSAESQLDHILISNRKTGTEAWCKAKWMDKNWEISDHKMVIAKILMKENRVVQSNNPRSFGRSWNIGNLKNQQDNLRYKQRLKEELENPHSIMALTPNQDSCTNLTDRWSKLCSVVSEVAGETLNNPNSPMTPKRRRAIADQKKAKFRKKHFPLRPGVDDALRSKNKARREAVRDHELNKCDNFFKNITKMHPMLRLREAYKFLKKYKRKSNAKKKFIPMAKWEDEVRGEGEARIVDCITEEDGKGMIPFPEVERIIEMIQSFKRGTAPGVDNINIELLQEGPNELFEELIRILEEAWNDNRIPEAWTHTIQIPIPKITAPKSIDDYRKISLCSIAYKIYAKMLLNALDEILPPLPQYQGAFLANRSTEDHIFTIRRITEEAWREGRTMYLLALDLAKAFPSVDHQALITILKHCGIPHALINRIIKACLHEKTAIQWFGQTTNFHNKNIGVKQGCPISPRLFTIVLNEVITTTVEVLVKFDLEENDHITLPIVLAYADDLIVMSDNLEDLDEFMREITPNLQSIGMSLNINKCEVLIRDPKGFENRRKDNLIVINGEKIKVVPTMRYLGAFLTSTINRKGSTKARIEKAIRGARMLVPFFRKHKPPWNTIWAIYSSVIAPVALFGMKATAMTKANRSALKNMEGLIISLFAQQCKRIPSRKITTLLRGRTIWRRVMNQRIKYWAHIRRRPTNNILQVAKRINPGRKKIGRPCFSWNDSLQADMLRSKIPLKEWEEAANDKGKLKNLANKIYDLVDSSDEDSITDLN